MEHLNTLAWPGGLLQDPHITLVCVLAEMDQLQIWLLKRVDWMDGALTEAAATASAAAAAPDAEALAAAGRAALASTPASSAGR